MKGMLFVGILVAVAAVAAVIMLVDDGTVDDDGYLYAVYTDADRNLDVIDVYESHYDGGTATALSQVYRHPDAVDGIDQFWSFDRKTGVGPFNSYYAAINLSSDAGLYLSDDSSERRMSASVGRIAYVLDPFDLSRTLNGHVFSGDLYNVMLMIPTVYWTSEKTIAERTEGNIVEGREYNVLYMSSEPTYKPSGHDTVTGMVAYAHSASTVVGKTDFKTDIYPLLGIGVYESYVTTDSDSVSKGLLVSQSGRVPASGHDVDAFKSFADALTPAQSSGPGSDYQEWNYYQWTLYKMMCYAVMGSKNSQVIVGAGYTEENPSSAVTGSTDAIGFVGVAESTRTSSGDVQAGVGKTASKLFIENGWGSLNEFLGDAFVAGDGPDSQILYAGNRLGGDDLLTTRHQPSTGLVWANVHASGEPQRIIADTSADPSTWDAPLTSDANRDSYFDPRYPGDVTNSAKSGVNSITVGGRWDNTCFAGVAFACAGYDISEANEYRGARLAYLLSE